MLVVTLVSVVRAQFTSTAMPLNRAQSWLLKQMVLTFLQLNRKQMQTAHSVRSKQRFKNTTDYNVAIAHQGW
jgi:hypothetical protein